MQSSDKQDATTEVEKVCKDWQAFIRTQCNDKCMYDLYKNESESLPELSGDGAHYPFMTKVLEFKYVKPQNFKHGTTVERVSKLAHS